MLDMPCSALHWLPYGLPKMAYVHMLCSMLRCSAAWLSVRPNSPAAPTELAEAAGSPSTVPCGARHHVCCLRCHHQVEEKERAAAAAAEEERRAEAGMEAKRQAGLKAIEVSPWRAGAIAQGRQSRRAGSSDGPRPPPGTGLALCPAPCCGPRQCMLVRLAVRSSIQPPARHRLAAGS